MSPAESVDKSLPSAKSSARRYSAGVCANCFFKRPGKGLLRIKAILQGDVQNGATG